MNVKDQILKRLKEVKKSIQLPAHIDFTYEPNTLTMILNNEAVGFDYYDSKGKKLNRNMQDDSAAFEGWAAVIKTYWKPNEDYKICLDVDWANAKELPDPENLFVNGKCEGISSGHYGRFLYRAGKFNAEYDWFVLSPKLNSHVNEFKNLLLDYNCTNHLPEEEAGDNSHSEIQVELSFHNNPHELVKLTNNAITGNVNRQLGCWLESNDGNIQFFTAGRSAIDLWNITGTTLNVFELKADNYKVGIISELFFYVEYCRDMFGEQAIFSPRKFDVSKSNKNGRGYKDLIANKVKEVRGFFLTNKYHPLVTDEVVNLLNSNNSGICFVRLPLYDLDYMKHIKNGNVSSTLDKDICM